MAALLVVLVAFSGVFGAGCVAIAHADSDACAGCVPGSHHNEGTAELCGVLICLLGVAVGVGIIMVHRRGRGRRRPSPMLLFRSAWRRPMFAPVASYAPVSAALSTVRLRC
jgi:hypothetical protein